MPVDSTLQLFETVTLATLPTPVVRLAGIGNALGHEHLFVKRDDLCSTLYGGNKPRKLEFLLGEAVRRNVRTVVTMGGCGSNHLLATALHARTLGIRTVGVIFPQPMTECVERNMKAYHGAGVELVRAPSKYLLPLYVAATLARVRLREGRSPLLIPGGGSSALGGLGFVNAGLELAAQVRAGMLPEPDQVFVPLGTGGTAGGLAFGLHLGGLATRVIAVRVIDGIIANRPRLLRRTREIAELYLSRAGAPSTPLGGASLPFAEDRIEIDHGWIGAGYGFPTDAAENAVQLFREKESLQLEFTYSGKAAAAFLHEAARNRKPLLFWLTYSSADMSQPVK